MGGFHSGLHAGSSAVVSQAQDSNGQKTASGPTKGGQGGLAGTGRQPGRRLCIRNLESNACFQRHGGAFFERGHPAATGDVWRRLCSGTRSNGEGAEYRCTIPKSNLLDRLSRRHRGLPKTRSTRQPGSLARGPYSTCRMSIKLGPAICYRFLSGRNLKLPPTW